MSRPIVGIIGGMGPKATSQLVNTIYSLYEVQKEWEFPHLLVDFNTTIPSRGRFFAGLGPSPANAISASAQMLEAAGADIIAVGCITAHHFIGQIRASTSAIVLDAVGLCRDHLANNGAVRPYLLGSEATCGGALFDDMRFRKIVPTCDGLAKVRTIIEDVKTGKISERTFSIYHELLDEAQRCRADTVVLGCSELSLLREHVSRIEVVDPMILLATEIRRLDLGTSGTT